LVPDVVNYKWATGPAMKIIPYALSDVGKKRDHNEDSYLVRADVGLFAVADGMGGHQAGEVASALGVGTVEGFLLNTLKRFFKLKVPDEQGVMKEFQGALREADARICEEASRHPEMLGMGTTLTLAFAADRRLFVAHVGDSRCYLLSGGELHQLTRDHTKVAELVRAGVLSAAEASRHPHRHVVTNVLGGPEPGVRVEMHKLDLEPGDVVVLCSDGLTQMVPDARLAAILAEGQGPERACERLVAEANERGGEDNITVVVARFEAA
jgi:PPM family protein phosphatase